MSHGYMIFPSHGFCRLISDAAWRYFGAPEAGQLSEYTKYTHEAAQMHQCFHQQPLQRSLITYRCESGNALCTPLPLPELWLLSLGHFCNSEREGTHMLMAESHCCMQKPSQYFKAIILQLKIIFLKSGRTFQSGHVGDQIHPWLVCAVLYKQPSLI